PLLTLHSCLPLHDALPIFVGTGASFIVTIEVAVLAVVVDFLRAQYMPALRAQAGLLAYAAIALVTRGGPSAYVNPASGGAFADPDRKSTRLNSSHQIISYA